MNRITTLGLAACGLVAGMMLPAQQLPKTGLVLHRIEVSDGKGNYVTGLQPKDFRILEDGIVQKLNTFAEGSKPAVQVLEDGATRPLSLDTWQKQVEAFDSIRESLENSYIVTYYPAQNPNQGFRKIDVQILSDTGKKYRVRHKPGYRPSK